MTIKQTNLELRQVLTNLVEIETLVIELDNELQLSKTDNIKSYLGSQVVILSQLVLKQSLQLEELRKQLG